MVWCNIDKSLILGAKSDTILVGYYLPPIKSTACKSLGGGEAVRPVVALDEELLQRQRGREVIIMGNLNARAGQRPRTITEGDIHDGGAQCDVRVRPFMMEGPSVM